METKSKYVHIINVFCFIWFCKSVFNFFCAGKVINTCILIPDFRSGFSVSGPISGPGPIIFKKVTTNIGSHYDNSTGTYCCRKNGVYVFTVHILKKSTDKEAKVSYVECKIEVNGVEIASAYAGSKRFIQAGSTSVVTNLTEGDNVTLVSSPQSSKLKEAYFSGFFLY